MIPRLDKDTAPLPRKARFLGWLAATLIRALSLTQRYTIEDRAGILEKRPDHSLIWVFWHNRLMGMPRIYTRHLKDRKGAVLTSPSRDGGVIAAMMECFGVAAVRGSSNKRAAAALVEMMRWIRGGYDLVVTPDGPRGPRYHLQPGLIKVAQKTGAAIFPIRVEYSNYWKFERAWDHFRVPKPFSRVKIVLEPYEWIDDLSDDDSFEAARLRVQTALNPDHETD